MPVLELVPEEVPAKMKRGGGNAGKRLADDYRPYFDAVMAAPGESFRVAEFTSATGAENARRTLIRQAKEAGAKGDESASPFAFGHTFDIEARVIEEKSGKRGDDGYKPGTSRLFIIYRGAVNVPAGDNAEVGVATADNPPADDAEAEAAPAAE